MSVRQKSFARRIIACVGVALCASILPAAAEAEGYYRFPALAGETVVFTAEGDLWRVPLVGGEASRLTTHAGAEHHAVASPDGKSIAFAAAYDGPTEVFVMPLSGGLPKRLSFEGGFCFPVGWTAKNEVLYLAQRHTGPSPQYVVIAVDPATLQRRELPLADISDAAVAADGRTVYFTRFGLAFSGDNLRGYRGGLLSRLWRYDLEGKEEAKPLVAVAGEKDRANDRRPMVWNDRLYFISDRDGHDNLWSMKPDGSEARQLTHEVEFGVRNASLDHGRIVYQLGADLQVYDVADGKSRRLAIDLPSDFDQERRRVVRRPLDFFEGAGLSPDGERALVLARGRIALMGVRALRRIDIGTPETARATDAEMSPDGRWVYAFLQEGGAGLSATDTGSPQIWRFATDGSTESKQLTKDDAGHRFGLWLSPDGKQLANAALDGKLYLLDVEKGENQPIDTADATDLRSVTWSSDSRYLSFVRSDTGVEHMQIFLYEPATKKKVRVTSDRFDSYAPAFTPDGKWLYFLSNREFKSLSESPWGDRNMGPYFDRRSRIYALALQAGSRFPFQPRDELSSAKPAAEEPKTAANKDGDKDKDKDKDKSKKPALPAIAWDGLAERLYEVPTGTGNYVALRTDGKLLYFLDEATASGGRRSLRTLKIGNDGDNAQDFLADVRQFELSADNKKLFLRRWAAQGRIGDMFIVPAGPKAPDRLAAAPTEIGKVKDEMGRTGGEIGRLLEALDPILVRAADWSVTVDPRAEWRQIFANAWQLHRDFFFDRDMHGLDWLKVREKYRPLVERVTDRDELNDVLAQMMGELGAMHSQIAAGDIRQAADGGRPAFLGAVLAPEADGARIAHVYRGDAELPGERSPLAQPSVDARDGDLIVAVNGQPVAAARDIAELLAGHAGEQMLLTLKRGSGNATREIKTVVKPVDGLRNGRLRYGDWEESRRAVVEAAGGGRIGYLHLRAMGEDDIATFAREFYAQFDREGLIIDVRRNNGGNIDSWIIEKLLRRAWAFWKPRYGKRTFYNMQQTFRGSLAVLIDERTYSDGETFAAGVKKLKLAPLIGMRTAGAGVWLNDRHTLLSDRGNVRTAEFPQFAVEDGRLLVENEGVEPDIMVENLPHATYGGDDAQLKAAINHLLEKLKDKK
ncbi:MAG TPA: S41 family peptidase [Reyranella sp.]|nr:S41 family peptidase [Reyranella sp.]